MPIGVGILGFAHGHVNSYCTKWLENKKWGVVPIAGWDHQAGRLQEAVDKYGIEACVTPEALLSQDGIDAVVVSAETSHHADLVEKAAAAGKTIILQKPMALTMADADRIVKAVRNAGVRFTMAWQMRVDPQNIKMKELLQGGDFGRVFMVRRRHGLTTHRWSGFADTWHVDPAANRDIWADDTSHAVDFIHWLLGVPDSVTAEIDTLYTPKVPNDNGIAIFRYKKGPIAEVTSSFTCAAGENTTEIIAENGSIIQNFGDGPSCNVPRPDGGIGLKWLVGDADHWTISDIATPPNHGHRIAGLAEPLAAFLRGERDAIATAEEGQTTLRMVLATYVSNTKGCRVNLDDPDIENV